MRSVTEALEEYGRKTLFCNTDHSQLLPAEIRSAYYAGAAAMAEVFVSSGSSAVVAELSGIREQLTRLARLAEQAKVHGA